MESLGLQDMEVEFDNAEPFEGNCEYDEQDRAILDEILGRRERERDSPSDTTPRKRSSPPAPRDPLACLSPLSPNGDIDLDIMGKAPISEVANFVIDRLGESNVELVHALVGEVGAEMALKVLRRAMRIEAKGGVLCPGAAPEDEAKRKSAGGVFISLIRRADGVSSVKVNKIIKSVEKRRRKRNWSPDRGTTAADRRKQRVLGRLDRPNEQRPTAAPSDKPQPAVFKRKALRRKILSCNK
jgi:hypothetical protein